MKRNIWRNKKGQIQGVDFALAMVIFMIMFAEIITETQADLQDVLGYWGYNRDVV